MLHSRRWRFDLLPCDSLGRKGCSSMFSPRWKTCLAKGVCCGLIPNPTLPERRTLQQSQADRSQTNQRIFSPRGQMKAFSYLNSPSHHVPWCYETRLWLCNTKPHESIWPRFFHSHIGTPQLQTTQALGQLGFSFHCFELIQIRCPISLCIKLL